MTCEWRCAVRDKLDSAGTACGMVAQCMGILARGSWQKEHEQLPWRTYPTGHVTDMGQCLCSPPPFLAQRRCAHCSRQAYL